MTSDQGWTVADKRRCRTRAVRLVIGIALASSFVGEGAAGQVRPRHPETDTVNDVVRGTGTRNVVRSISRDRLTTVIGARSDSGVRIVSPSGIRALPQGGTVALRLGEFVFNKVAMHPIADSSLSSSGRLGWELPYRWVTLDAEGNELALRPRLEIEGDAIKYHPASRTFRGVGLIGLEDSLRPERGRLPLVNPLRMQITLTTGGGVVEPRNIALDHTSLDYLPLSIVATDTAGLQARIRTAVDTAGVLVPIRIALPPLTLRVLPSVVEGFGLATARLLVQLPPGVDSATKVLVTLSSPTVSIDPPTLLLTPNDAQTATIRSGTPGRVSLVAEAAGFMPAPAGVEFAWPWRFLTATLVGILLGGYLKFAIARGRLTRKGFLRAAFRGAPFGILAGLLAALGVDITGFRLTDPGAWIGVVVVVAIGAYLGRASLERGSSAATKAAAHG